jgi:hypothetical protein
MECFESGGAAGLLRFGLSFYPRMRKVEKVMILVICVEYLSMGKDNGSFVAILTSFACMLSRGTRDPRPLSSSNFTLKSLSEPADIILILRSIAN